LRLEDPPLLIGAGRFVADLSFPSQLHMRVVRSAYAHGRIAAIDSAAGLAAPGVVAVWTARDIADLPPIGLRGGLGTPTDVARLTPYLQPVLARERVRYVGESVAAVFAEDPYLAEDAADLVDVRVEELPVLLTADDSPRDFVPGHGSEADIIRKGMATSTPPSPGRTSPSSSI
jgi:carbon-monoxide dehydrogenase large subunit/6-hydroxypseudooxynicotine dehydrogenase subunit gamma